MRIQNIFTRALIAVAPLIVGSEAIAARTTTYYYNDGLGSVVAATNDAGQVLWRKDYAPFGEQIDTTPDTERQSKADKVAPDPSTVKAAINAQKQAGHIPGTPQNINRLKQGKPTSTFFGKESGDKLTRIANEKGKAVPNRPNVKEHEFGISVGTGPNSGMQSKVRVHTSPKTGEIHGHPSGPERR